MVHDGGGEGAGIARERLISLLQGGRDHVTICSSIKCVLEYGMIGSGMVAVSLAVHNVASGLCECSEKLSGLSQCSVCYV